MPGLFEPILDMLPTKARIVPDVRNGGFDIHFAKVDPSSGAAVHQGSLNTARRKVDYRSPTFFHEPVLTLTRQEVTTLHEELGKSLGKTPETALQNQLKTANSDLSKAQQERDDARNRNRALIQEAGRHKNELRDAQARLTQVSEMYASLLDRLSTK
ncbi:hypothetical protein O1L60_31340 [Streptomyces diastatochromogenes]|nr:hypothetical protein [Streptomyces diastatochromogenes]